jgi:vacuolar-type H+-ATPase subunit I/STV1
MNVMFGILPTLEPATIGWGAVSVAAMAIFINQLMKAKRNVVGVPPVGELQGQIIALEKRIAKLEAGEEVGASRRKAIYEKLEDLSKTAAHATEQLRKDLMHEISEMRKEHRDDNKEMGKRVDDLLIAVGKGKASQ